MNRIQKPSVNYRNASLRREILIRQRRGIWTEDQIESLGRHFRLKPGMKMLDAGCGYGCAMRTWGPRCLPGGELVGLDRDRKLLSQAARFCRKEGLSRVTRFVRGDICEIPFSDNEFDISLAHVVFCHLAEPEQALDEMIRVTRPGGCIAVFDNAAAGGRENSWLSWFRPTRAQAVLQFEMTWTWIAGRGKLGQGDLSVNCYMPGWMEARGLEHVDVRTNERVTWIAPPYRSEAQQVFLQNERERCREHNRFAWPDREERARLRAGGMTERRIEQVRQQMMLAARAYRKAMKAGTASLAASFPFWCVWGFKPARSVPAQARPAPAESYRVRTRGGQGRRRAGV